MMDAPSSSAKRPLHRVDTSSDSGTSPVMGSGNLDSQPLMRDASPVDERRRLQQQGQAGLLLPPPPPRKYYKRRYFGLFQLTLLNIISSWNWLTYAPVSSTAATYFDVSIASINWLSTAFLFAFVVASPLTISLLNRGPKPALLACSALILVGNWVRYGGARLAPATSGFALTMLGQIFIGLGQPFVLAAPTRYSEMWFGPKGRIVATAIPSLANPLGGALGQLIDPFWATDLSQVSGMVLWVAVISTVATVPSIVVPARPPSGGPGGLTGPAEQQLRERVQWGNVLRLAWNLDFHLLFWPFAVYCSCFNAFSSVINNILYPYGYTETAAGITGALLIFVGIGATAVASPILDRKPHWRLPYVKLAVPLIAAMYLAFVWAPQTRSDVAPYVIAALQGAASFGLIPVALEYLVEVTYPDVGPEVTSTLCWAGGQLGGGVFIVALNALADRWPGQPAGNLKAGLVFLAAFAWAAVPLPMLLGYFGTGQRKRERAEVQVGGAGIGM